MDLNAPYPAQVSLTDEGAKGYVFRLCPTGQRLYTYDPDPAGQTACVKGCLLLWEPVIAPPRSKTLGDWTAIQRPEGVLQWAYRGKPVYTLVHDQPYYPGGDGMDNGRWHLLPYEK